MSNSQSRWIKLARATRTQKPVSPNMAAQALCEPAQKDANKLFGNFESGFVSVISRHEIRFTRLKTQLTFTLHELHACKYCTSTMKAKILRLQEP
jgi:hypothetical protein